jgi:hypothetical protein
VAAKVDEAGNRRVGGSIEVLQREPPEPTPLDPSAEAISVAQMPVAVDVSLLMLTCLG